METLLHFFVQRGVLSPAYYWPLRLLSTIALGPVLAVAYLFLFSWRAPRQPSVAAKSLPTMWVDNEGQLKIRRPQRRTPILTFPTLVSPPSPKPHPRGWH